MYARRELDVQQRIYDILRKFAERGVKFNGVAVTRVVMNYEIEYSGRKRYADIAVLVDGDKPLLVIETKKKYEREGSYRAERRFHVTSEEVLGQVFSYVAILKAKGIYVPFVATANDKQIAVFQVPEDIDRNVNWEAIDKREYGKVLRIDYIYGVLRPNYMLDHKPIRFSEDFFADLLDKLTGIYVKKYKLEDVKRELSWILIEELRGFVETLYPFVLDYIATPDGKYKDEWEQKVNSYAEEKGYKPRPEHLAREMAYVLLNKIIFYKVLERYYKDLPKLEPLYSKKSANTVSQYTVNQYLSRLNEFFNKAVEVTKDFEPIFKTGIYDEIKCVESEEVLKLLDWLITLIDQYRIERFGDVVGYVYEELIPAEERHQLGQFYTPKPIAELIVKWCIRSPDDRVLDPGCGSGTFLVEAYKRLAGLKLGRKCSEVKYVPRDVHKQILSQLYGIDINEFPAHLTAMNLAMRNPREPCSITNIVVEDFFAVTPAQKKLTPYKVKTAEGEKPVEIVFKDFDAVVGNPPYTRWTEIREDTRKLILKSYGDILSKYDLSPQVSRGVEPGIYVYWIMHSTGFLKNGGRLGMIISDSWLQTDYGVNFGKFLLDNFRIRAVIDIATKVFPVPMVGSCIILLEKEPDHEKRMSNNVVFMLLQPKKALIVEDVLKLIEEFSAKEPKQYMVSDEIMINVVLQRKIYEENTKWINYVFSPDIVLNALKNNQLITPLSKYFEVSYGNILYVYLTSTGKINGVRNPGGEAFFYLSESRAQQLQIPPSYLRPLLPSPDHMNFYTFTSQDWDAIRKRGAECYLFLCHDPRNQLPGSVLRYIQMGEGPNADIRLRNGKPVSESLASRIREELSKEKPGQPFYGWYDLGGVLKAHVYVARGSQYFVRFVLARCHCALDDRILALIPKKGVFIEVPEERAPSAEKEPRSGVVLTEKELKALLAYLNSSFSQLQAEIKGRSTGGGMLELDVKPLSDFLVLDIKKLPDESIEKLAELFDRLENEARRLGGAHMAENVFGSELAAEITGRSIGKKVDGLFNTVIKEIDYEIGKILGFSTGIVDAVRNLVVDMAKRRLARAREAKPEAIRGEETTGVELPKKKGKQKKEASEEKHVTLDKFAKK
ncbi:MAG: N-6 DNA methylase [Desulfurococcaceae archaeon]